MLFRSAGETTARRRDVLLAGGVMAQTLPLWTAFFFGLVVVYLLLNWLPQILVQLGFASQVRFHGKRYPWFVSDVTKKDWEWLLNSMVYGYLFPEASPQERESLRSMGERWKVCRLASTPRHSELIMFIESGIRKEWYLDLRAAPLLVHWVHLLGPQL